MRKHLIHTAAFLLALPTMAQVEPKIHKLCSEAKDYAGCIKTINAASVSNLQNDLLSNEQQQKIGNYVGLVICEFGQDGMARMDADDSMRYFQYATGLDPALYRAVDGDPKASENTRRIALDFINQRCSDQLPDSKALFLPTLVPTGGCPPGTSKYTVDQPSGFLGLGRPKKVDIGCMTIAEANRWNIEQQNLRRSPVIINQPGLQAPKTCYSSGRSTGYGAYSGTTTCF